MWENEKVGIADTDTRIAEIRYTARNEAGDLVGVCSSAVEKGIYNGLYFHGMRVLVAAEFRQNLLAFELLAHLVEELADNRRGNFEVGPVGVKVVIQTPIVAERGQIHCVRTFQFPINKTPKQFLLSGFTPKGHPEYCHYFTNDSDATKGALARWVNTAETLGSEASVQAFSQDPQNADRGDVLAFLEQQSSVNKPARQQQIVSSKSLYSLKRNGQLVAVCELIPRLIREINGSLLGIHPHGSANTGDIDILGIFAREIYDQLNSAGSHRIEDAVGLFTVYSDRTDLPVVCPVTGFHLHGADAQQRELRVRFFDDLKVKVPQ